GAPPEMVADLVPRDRPEPVAERVAGPVLAEGLDVRRHRLEYLLKDVRHVLLGQAHGAAPVVDQGRVQRRQPLPRRRLAVLQPHQQAARRRGLASGLSPRLVIVGHAITPLAEPQRGPGARPRRSVTAAKASSVMPELAISARAAAIPGRD